MEIIVGFEGNLIKKFAMDKRILALDPSGTGTTGICLIGKTTHFEEFQSSD
jgi:hypothetical protein